MIVHKELLQHLEGEWEEGEIIILNQKHLKTAQILNMENIRNQRIEDVTGKIEKFISTSADNLLFLFFLAFCYFFFL